MLTRSTRALCTVLGGYGLLGGLATLTGWASGSALLTDWAHTGITMKANAALAAAAAGGALLLMVWLPSSRVAARTFALAAAALGALTLFEHLSRLNLGIDTLLFDEAPGARATAAPGRMGPPASTSFLLIGSGVALLGGGTRARRIATNLGLLAACIAGLSVTGYVFGAGHLFTLPRLTGVAVQTATMLLALAIGLMVAVPERGLVGLLLRDDPGGLVLRRLLLPVLMVPLALGWLCLLGERRGLYDAPFGTAVLAFLMILALSGVVAMTARRISATAAALRRSERELSDFFENGSVGLHWVGPDGTILRANQTELDLLGYRREEYVGRNIAEFHTDPSTIADVLARLARGETLHEYPARMRCKNGSIRDVLIDSNVLFEDGRFVHTRCFTRDVTELRDRERALRASRDHLNLALAAARMYTWTWDFDNDRLELSPNFGEVFGRPSLSSVAEGIPAVHPEDAPDHMARVRAAIAAEGSYRSEFRIIREDSGAIVWLDERGMVVPGANNGANSVLAGVTIDITDRKKAEEELHLHRHQLQALVETKTAELAASLRKLQNTERLAALGNMAAGLGHDIANLVLPIRARLEPLERACADADSHEDIDAIRRAMTHLTNLSAGLRLMAQDPQRDDGSGPASDLRTWWEQAQGVMRGVLPKNTRLLADIPEGLGVAMPTHRLTQVVFNVVQNAAEALAGSGTGVVTIRASAAPSGSSESFAEIRIVDNGPGMRPEVLSRCFEPYFSTKGRAIATGMGLGMVRGMVESAGGYVSAESRPGQGVTLLISLPASSNGHLKDGQAGRPKTAAVAVDEPRTASLTEMFLDGLGFPVLRSGRAEIPDVDLWVVQDPAGELAEGYLRQRSERTLILLRSDHAASRGEPEVSEGSVGARIHVIPLDCPPSRLREALMTALQQEPSRAGGG